MSENTKVEDLSFKEASIELEKIVRSLEATDEDELELEDALSKYARGVELLNSLRERLKAAEQKVEVLTQENDIQIQDTASAPSTQFLDE